VEWRLSQSLLRNWQDTERLSVFAAAMKAITILALACCGAIEAHCATSSITGRNFPYLNELEHDRSAKHCPRGRAVLQYGRREIFAQAIAKGQTQIAAYEAAGYEPHDCNASIKGGHP
jgi:hypothetical protein